MSQNIKNNLFRFVTLRNPQLIEEKDKQLGFIYHPDETTGEFYASLRSASQGEEKQELLSKKASFESSAFKTKKNVRDVNLNLYNFSSWLMRNKNALSYAEILDNVTSNNLTTFTGLGVDEMPVWDNLIYQTITKDSVYVREALIQLLIANKFVLHFNSFSAGLTEVITFTEDQEKEFTRRANASVVISREILLETYNESSTNTKPRSANIEHQKRLGDLLTAKYDKLALKNLAEELKGLQKSYKDLEAANYKIAIDNHQKDVDTIIDTTGTVQLVNQWDVEAQANIQVEKYTYDPLPEFTYTKAVEIDAPTLQGALSSVSSKYLTDNKLETLATYDAILKEVKRLSKACDRKVEQLLPKTGKSVLKGGANMRVEDPFKATLTNFGDVDVRVAQMIEDDVSADTIPLLVASEIDPNQIAPSSCYAVSIAVRTTGEINGSRNWTFVVGITYNNQYSAVTAFDQSLSFVNDATVINSTSFDVEQTLPNHSKVGLFFNLGPISKPALVGNPILSGTITLANGDTLDFSETIAMVPYIKELRGTKFLDFKCEEETPVESPSVFGKIYGVTNLGIADFRRVEQEVCCYVPGEVSHIENVMAREYKERSTRSLTSSEFTTEQTDERERENLTDTTSTERNEMQSEVASVLDQDKSKNYGGNASVSGDKFGLSFSASAYFDSASSSSSSNSNTQAQTYAQEVTERAMERIVQKTQTKRTSRILKEFEENNSHGFDNRKGESHVTGVYRWVDKVYKNTLINYGKRLMYEFAIPEPSKFFQEAVWKELDETGKVESGVILPELPEHPTTLGMTSANILGEEDSSPDLTTRDYRKIAAKYNAEVASIPEETKIITKSYIEEVNKQGARAVTGRAYTGDDFSTEEGLKRGGIEIPEGYTCTKVEAQISYNREGSNGSGQIYFNVGTTTTHIPQTTFMTGSNFTLLENASISDRLNFSFIANDVNYLVFNIILHCELLDSKKEQWQNETYNAIMGAYYDRVQEYNDAIREKEANEVLTPEAEKLTFNPLQNQSIMLRELKRVAIELLIDKTRVSRSNFYDMDEDTGVSEVIRDEAFQTHASTVKFFEQAFDWDIMAYVFYPYFYAAEKDWKKLFQSQDVADPLFQAFLQSGMARTVVPVRPGFEDAVNWYMTTGEIWNGQGLVVDQDDDLYISIAEEMQTVDGTVEGTWETRLPTALTILQADSIGLDVQGLPCNTGCDPDSTNPIKPSTNLIGGPDGVGYDF
ncbi:MAG: hypothetical protein AAF901_07860, partial [Bacteroidota bacterium]